MARYRVNSIQYLVFIYLTTDAASVPDGESKENQTITSVTMDDYIIVPLKFDQLIDCVRCRFEIS